MERALKCSPEEEFIVEKPDLPYSFYFQDEL